MDVHKALLTLKDEPDGEKALVFLHASSYFAPLEIQIDLFAGTLGGCEDVDQAVELLKRHSLVKTAEKERCILIGTEVRKEVKNLLREKSEEQTVLKLAIQVLRKHSSSGSSSILEHEMSVFEVAKGYPELLKKTSKFPVDIMEGLRKIGKDLEASVFGLEALNVLQRFIGEYHSSTLILQLGVGSILLRLRRVDEGLEVLCDFYRRISEATGGGEVDATLGIIAKTMSEKTSEPETRVRRLVFGDATVSVTNNNSTLNLWCEYALLLSKLDRWTDEALSILNEVLEKRRVLLDPDDDDICEVEDSIAHVHLKRNDYRQALEVYQRVYEKRKSTLGENCMKTQISRNGIALAYNALRMFDEALMEHEAVAEKTRRIMGDDDPSYFTLLGKIAYILNSQRKYEKSIHTYTLLYNDFRRVFGEKHLQTLQIKYNISSVLLAQDKMEECFSALHEVLQGYLEVLGPMHSKTIDIIKEILFLQKSSKSEFHKDAIKSLNTKK